MGTDQKVVVCYAPEKKTSKPLTYTTICQGDGNGQITVAATHQKKNE